jgi:hypothetical protein
VLSIAKRGGKSKLGKVISNILLGGLAIALAIFTGSRTLDLIGQWLPANQDIYKWLALAAFEGGFALWALFFATAAEGAPQRGLALLMIIVDFLGIAIATVADLVLTGAKDGKLPAINGDMQQAIVVFIGIIIVLNVAAFMAAKLISPAKLREWAVQDAEDVIYSEEQKAIKSLAPSVAGSMAPIRAQQWANQTWDRLLPGTSTSNYRVEDVTDSYPAAPQIAAPVSARLAQTGRLDRPNALPEADTSNKRGQGAIDPPKKKESILNRVKSVFKAADENQPQIVPDDQDVVGKGGQAATKTPRPFHSGSGAAAAAEQAARANSVSSQQQKQRVAARRARRAKRQAASDQ